MLIYRRGGDEGLVGDRSVWMTGGAHVAVWGGGGGGVSFSGLLRRGSGLVRLGSCSGDGVNRWVDCDGKCHVSAFMLSSIFIALLIYSLHKKI